MTTSKISFNRFFLAISLFLIAVTFAIIDTANSLNALNENEPLDQSCLLTLDLSGSGQVMMTTNGGQTETLEQGDNELPLHCSDEVTLTAEPAARWRFDHWQGVPAADRHRATVTVTAPAAVTAVFVPRAVTYETVETPFYDRGGNLVTQVERFEPLWQPLTGFRPASSNAAPLIELWYGQEQSFGQIGTPQEWINLLGNVSDPDEELLNSFSYTLNGGTPRDLSYGGSGSLNDLRRLYNPGDFNIDIDKDDLLLLPQTNEVVITAEDSVGVQSVYTATISYDASTTWDLPYQTNWAGASAISEQAQIVDGKWDFSDSDGDGVIDGVYPVETGYDRVLAIGEGNFYPNDGSQWTEFEATVPVTVHGIKEEGFIGNQWAPAIGVIMRWEGHTDTPKVCEQPKCGYTPIGAASWYEWDRKDDTRETANFSLWVNTGNKVQDPNGLLLEFETMYYWKVRVDNSLGPQGLYHLRMWAAGDPEPDTWHTLEGNQKSLHKGSIELISHHVDVTFGDVQVCPLAGCPGPEISDVTAVPGTYDAALTWKTDLATASRIDYWSDPADVKTMSVDGYATDHAVQLENLEAETIYKFKIYSVDRFGNESETDVDTFTTEPMPIDTFTLTVAASGAGTVSIDPVKVEYDFGDQVTLTAVPDEGAKSYFVGWSGDVESDENPLLIVINEDTEVQAKFEKYKVGAFASYLPTTLRGQ